MRKIFIFLLFLTSLGGCKNVPKKVTDNSILFNRDSNIIRISFPPSEYVKTTVKLLELREKYYAMFDSIVFRSVTTRFNRVKKLGFDMGIWSSGENLYNLYIYPLEYRFMSIHLEESVFYFDGFQFNYSGDIIEEMFTHKKDTVLFRVDPNLQYQYDLVREGDVWHYIIKDNKVTFDSKFLHE